MPEETFGRKGWCSKTNEVVDGLVLKALYAGAPMYHGQVDAMNIQIDNIEGMPF